MQTNYAEPSRRLRHIWLEWIDLHASLQKSCSDVSSPFLSAMSAKSSRKRLMFVGKATKDDWGGDPYRVNRRSRAQVVRERLSLNRRFIENGGVSSAFWCSFFRLAALGPGVDGMIWSNVAKIGSTTGNPTGPLLSQQAELAKLTLLEEVREYRPSLVVFVPGNYAQKIIEDAFGFTKKGWKDSPDGNVSWLRYSPEFPKVRFLWVRHPQGKTTQEVWYWTAKAKELLSE